MQRLNSIFTSRLFHIVSLIIAQFVVIIVLIMILNSFNVFAAIAFQILNAIVLLYVINRNDNTTYLLTWAILILGIPLIGGTLYILVGGKKIQRNLSRIIPQELKKNKVLVSKNILNDNGYTEDIVRVFRFMEKNSYFPVYKNTIVDYLSTGEYAFKNILEDLNKAEKFIFIETFILSEGVMWDEILKILIKKIKTGVKVYLMYDDAGCITTLPANYHKKLEGYGIDCTIFNPINIKIESKINNRNHRKIFVIDNKVAYMGGFNIADEYINEYKRFGYWKDTGSRLEGEAVWNCTVMFIQFYNAMNKNKQLDYLDFKLYHSLKSDDLVLPFSYSPKESDLIGYNFHLYLINNAKKSIYIHTPYLIIDYTMTTALKIAAKNGVDIFITTPYIPDKYYVSEVTRSKYQELIENNINIYEYLPGFIHSKLWIIDDKLATIGTINMDFRSYHLNFESNVLFTNKECIKMMKQDYDDILNVSKQITIQDCYKVSAIRRFIRAILNVFSPLM